MPELVAVQVRVVYSPFVLYFVHASCALLIAGARAADAADPVRDGGAYHAGKNVVDSQSCMVLIVGDEH